MRRSPGAVSSVRSLLAEIGARAPRPLTVILERDGAFPPMRDLLAQLDRARQALAAGRARREARERERNVEMRPEFEAFLALLYTDAEVRSRFLADSRGEASRAGMTAAECEALERIDRRGLELAARSFAHKRARKKRRSMWTWRSR